MLIHDIKNPAGLILGYAEMLLDESFELVAEAARDLCRQIQENGLTLMSLVDNYLNLARIEAGRMVTERRRLDLNQILSQVASRYQGKASRRKITMDFLPWPVLCIDADEHALDRVFANLFQNAIKFTPYGGRIAIDVQAHDREVRVAITDTGSGIASEQLPFVLISFIRLPVQNSAMA